MEKIVGIILGLIVVAVMIVLIFSWALPPVKSTLLSALCKFVPELPFCNPPAPKDIKKCGDIVLSDSTATQTVFVEAYLPAGEDEAFQLPVKAGFSDSDKVIWSKDLKPLYVIDHAATTCISPDIQDCYVAVSVRKVLEYEFNPYTCDFNAKGELLENSEAEPWIVSPFQESKIYKLKVGETYHFNGLILKISKVDMDMLFENPLVESHLMLKITYEIETSQ